VSVIYTVSQKNHTLRPDSPSDFYILRQQDICLTEFRRLLKTFLFHWDSAHCDFFVLMAPGISTLTYLLTLSQSTKKNYSLHRISFFFFLSGLKDEKLIKKQTCTKTEACKLYGLFWSILNISSKCHQNRSLNF